jgi:hypothetical protein
MRIIKKKIEDKIAPINIIGQILPFLFGISKLKL